MAKLRVPHLFHIGTQKAGSSYLYNLFKAHPEVSLSSQGLAFYTRNFDRGVEWYVNSFAKGGHAVDTSPKYFMQGELAAPRIKKWVTDHPPLFLLVLRNPIDYLHSHYQMHLRKGYFRKHSAMYPEVPNGLVDFVKTYPDYLKRGCYFKILEEHWLSHFHESQFKLVFFEELITHTDHVMRGILDFFGLPYAQLSTVPSSKNTMLRHPFLYKAKKIVVKSNLLKSILKKSRFFNFLYEKYLASGTPVLSQADRDWLQRYFSEDVEKLRERIGEDIPAWFDFGSDRSLQ